MKGVIQVLYLEDSARDAELVRGQLRADGLACEVTVAPDREAFEAALGSRRWDLVLCDYNLPGYDGLSALMLARETGPDIPVLIVSGSLSPEDAMACMRAGATDYLLKQRGERLSHAIRRALEEVEQRRLSVEAHREISESRMSTIFALAKLAESRDEDTGHHIERTQTYCRLLARELRGNGALAPILTDTYVEDLYHAAPLHDVGKVAIPDAILLKPGRLDPQEFEVMKTHAAIGARTLQAVYERYPQNSFISMGVEIARSHHERWDGAGYPDGLAGQAIPLSARIMAVSDVYDALRSKRVYKPAFSHGEAREIIFKSAGSHFDPDIIGAFEAIETKFAEIRETMDESQDGGDRRSVEFLGAPQ